VRRVLSLLFGFHLEGGDEGEEAQDGDYDYVPDGPLVGEDHGGADVLGEEEQRDCAYGQNGGDDAGPQAFDALIVKRRGFLWGGDGALELLRGFAVFAVDQAEDEVEDEECHGDDDACDGEEEVE